MPQFTKDHPAAPSARRALVSIVSPVFVAVALAAAATGCSSPGATTRPASTVATPSTQAASTQPQPSAMPPGKLLPPDPALAPLSFMAGRWFSINPNGSVNREQWTSPRGKTMTGSFHQTRRDGSPVIYEFSAIEVKDGQVILHLRHFHTSLEIEHDRPHAEIYFLTDSGPRSATFTPSPDASVPREKGVVLIRYSLDEQGRLVQEIRYAPDSPEEDYRGVSMPER